MTKSRKHTVRTALIVVAIASLVLAGGIIAGNMGFKLTQSLEAGGASPTANEQGINFLALPYNPKTTLVTAKDLFIDVCDTAGTGKFCKNNAPAILASVQQHRKTDDSFNVYNFDGSTVGPNGWDLKAGEMYAVEIVTGVSYLVPGTHNPDLVINLIGGDAPDFCDGGVSGTGPALGTSCVADGATPDAPCTALDATSVCVDTSASGLNFYANPYHSVAKNARELFTEMGGNIQQINQLGSVGFVVYTFGGGNLPPNGFDLRKGEGYIVKVGGAGQRYKPLHY